MFAELSCRTFASLRSVAARAVAARACSSAGVLSKSAAPPALLAQAHCLRSVCAAARTSGVAAAALAAGVALAAFASSDTTACSPAAVANVLPKPKVLFVLGGPGAGKGTQCAKLVDGYGFVHLSAGDLLRAERKSGSKDGEMINEYIKAGKIVPVAVTLALLRRAMEKSGQELFLVDGFPRNWDNVQGWEAAMTGAADVVGVLFYDCPEAEMERRLLERGLTSGRVDDNADSIRLRFNTYLESTMPIVEHFDESAMVHRIMADATPERVYRDSSAVADRVVCAHLLQLSQGLLDAIAAGDWEAYSALCDESLTCFEAEAVGHLVEGMDFHRFYFEMGNVLDGAGQNSGERKAAEAVKAKPGHNSTISAPKVRMLGPGAAVVTYVRLVQSVDASTGAPSTKAFEETRVWRRAECGRWKNVHFHRTFVGSDPAKW